MMGQRLPHPLIVPIFIDGPRTKPSIPAIHLEKFSSVSASADLNNVQSFFSLTQT